MIFERAVGQENVEIPIIIGEWYRCKMDYEDPFNNIHFIEDEFYKVRSMDKLSVTFHFENVDYFLKTYMSLEHNGTKGLFDIIDFSKTKSQYIRDRRDKLIDTLLNSKD